MLYDEEKHSHSISSLHPLLYGFGHPIKEMSVFLESREKNPPARPMADD
jgi:hypothetical protein